MFNIWGIFLICSILLAQLFVHFIYRINLNIKYSKFNLSCNQKPINILKNSLEQKYQNNFIIKLNKNWFIDHINTKKKYISIQKDFLSENIYAVVNMIYIKFFNELLTKKHKLIGTIFKYLITLSITLSWIFLIFNWYFISLSLCIFFILMIAIEFIFYYKFLANAYILSKNYFIEKFHDQHLALILSYLKYKKFSFFYKYLAFYVEIIAFLAKWFKNWGSNE
ncbi:hypothetical protein RRG44_00550 [Mycoplasmopsis cynos]|uniref:hypothetical protein n=1 Tax=Mycoplasmopsis cynos TaxID=171284 RepID=UPI0024C8187C|nr:hypothetical protein [Mycoplasmopsis cynos]WAM04595.1 hypothetical protein ONA01_06445 [Mycoplasmopsis cynos]WQQ13408.1 hypothetical protein RRG58_01520 [Mycoplasmopsis cynos]WQQ13683.1 hypothetical protein RRG52_02930 [Mycoplasmopsis cynos]WQQ19310.1 hypothetical protein RRG44_00550 [Mycoplasmopsis cynos]